MEKRISFFEFQSAKSVAKAIDPKLREKASLQKKAIALKAELDDKKARLQREIDLKTGKLKEEFDKNEKQIALLEAGIVQTLGFRVSDLVKKVIEPTGKTDPKTGKPITVTKYLPTDIVKYDEQAKEFVITVPDEEETIVPPTTEGVAGSDYDKDAESFQESEANSAVVTDGPTDVTSATEFSTPTAEAPEDDLPFAPEEENNEESIFD